MKPGLSPRCVLGSSWRRCLRHVFWWVGGSFWVSGIGYRLVCGSRITRTIVHHRRHLSCANKIGRKVFFSVTKSTAALKSDVTFIRKLSYSNRRFVRESLTAEFLRVVFLFLFSGWITFSVCVTPPSLMLHAAG